MEYINVNIKEKDHYVIHGILSSYISYPLSVLTGIHSLAIEVNHVFNLVSNKKLMPEDKIYTNDFDYLYNGYGVNLIVANKKYLDKDVKYNFSKFNNFYENEEYIVYIRKENM